VRLAEQFERGDGLDLSEYAAAQLGDAAPAESTPPT
jgi:hypothetical protein